MNWIIKYFNWDIIGRYFKTKWNEIKHVYIKIGNISK